MMNDTISDMLTRIRNALKAKKSSATVIYSKVNVGILAVLEDEGYITGFTVRELRKNINVIDVDLKYYNGKPVIEQITRASKPSRRIYFGATDVPSFYNGLGISVLSTSKGIVSNRVAREQNVGGELICNVF